MAAFMENPFGGEAQRRVGVAPALKGVLSQDQTRQTAQRCSLPLGSEELLLKLPVMAEGPIGPKNTVTPIWVHLNLDGWQFPSYALTLK